MRNRPLLIVALVSVSLAGVGGVAAQLGLLDEGVQFPDSSVQTTAAETPGQWVQGRLQLLIPDFDFCEIGDLYAVPAGKRLRIEWMSVGTFEWGLDDFEPVDVNIMTWLEDVQISHPLVRLDGAIEIGESFYVTAHFNTSVTMYNQGGKTVQVHACRDSDTDGTNVIVTFHGQLFNE